MQALNRLTQSLPDIEIKNVIIGTFDTAVLSKHWGLASTLRNLPCDMNKHGVTDAGGLVGKSVSDIAKYVLSDNLLEASLGMATINSAIKINYDKLVEVNALDVLLKQSKNKEVAVVGHFPLVNQIKSIAKKLNVFEKNPKEGDLPEHMMFDILPNVDVVAITATSLINHTFHKIMNHIKPSSFVLMLGPSTPLSTILFDYKVDVLSGTIIENEELFLQTLMQGCSYRQLKGIKRMTMIKESGVNT